MEAETPYHVHVRIYPGSLEYQLMKQYGKENQESGALGIMVRCAVRKHLKSYYEAKEKQDKDGSEVRD